MLLFYCDNNKLSALYSPYNYLIYFYSFYDELDLSKLICITMLVTDLEFLKQSEDFVSITLVGELRT